MSTNPNTIKSFEEVNEGKRSSEVLIHTLEELEKTKKQLDIAVKGIKAVLDDELFCNTADGGLIMYLYTALERIEELNNG